jgi:hypothetical protein
MSDLQVKYDNEHCSVRVTKDAELRLSSLVFGSAGYSIPNTIPVDGSDARLSDNPDAEQIEHIQFSDVSMMLNALDHYQELEGLFDLKDIDSDLAFALRHAIIFFLTRLDQYGATACGLMVESITHFMQENKSLKHFVRPPRNKIAD